MKSDQYAGKMEQLQGNTCYNSVIGDFMSGYLH